MIESDYLPRMDKNDPDFYQLFETSKLMKYLGKAIGRFSFALYKDLKISEEVVFWSNNVSYITSLILNLDKPSYRDRIAVLESKLTQDKKKK